MPAQRIVVTGANGFIGRNFIVRLSELGMDAVPLSRESTRESWFTAIADADAVIHLAGANRPTDPAEFMAVNHGTADLIAEAVAAAGHPVRIAYASSSRAEEPTDYGRSKLAGEERLKVLAEETGSPVHILRLPNVFGKWARPNYNSAVATFCHNIARGLPIQVNDPAAPLSLVYIDDVMAALVAIVNGEAPEGAVTIDPIYHTTVGAVAETIAGFRQDRSDNLIDSVGTGLTRALYSTYVSALPLEEFSYVIAAHSDPRGSFSEILKTRTSGQFSYFTAHPGVTRGGHYHHSKTEKFLIVHGIARFGFRHVVTGETHEIIVSGERPEIVETVPGWTHDVTNIGDTELISLLWANEIFDRAYPDTIAAKV
ncbi:NAD-dependent epimerase/dehydratase family protein [Sphingomonas sp. dw_22]|uniref:UDP-2-acetamido-2,6-beta-L-arabino-hexul-4-ose reductase n=1 Tax=Sphingomonas sp. dw_22 TaxID=2721175 RepID=UPI001BD6527D|nr:NAD-dependent epimerase/dehydratase family protein [Sphingomonas sp. dw_22]